jgi:hypothetical protein
MLTTFLSHEVDNDEVEDDVSENEVGEAAFGTDPKKVLLVRWVHLKIRTILKIVIIIV